MFDFVLLPPQRDTTRAWAERIAVEVPSAAVHVAETREEALALLPDADAAFGTLDPELLAVAPNLRWVQAPMASPPAGYYFDELVEHPARVTNFRGVYNDHVAAHALALLMAIARNLPYYLDRQRAREWAPDARPETVIDLPNATVLVIGVGGIGAQIASLVSAFGSRVLGVDPRRTDVPPGMEELHPTADLDALLPEADVVILAMPHTPETYHLFDGGRFTLFRRGAVFINVGRGKTTDLDAVADALRSGRLRAAGLDVYDEEPLAPGHALWTLPGALLTPHVGAAGPYLDERRFAVIRENAVRFGEGRELINEVDKKQWY